MVYLGLIHYIPCQKHLPRADAEEQTFYCCLIASQSTLRNRVHHNMCRQPYGRKPSGSVFPTCFIVLKFRILPKECVCMFNMVVAMNRKFPPLNSINRLIFAAEACRVSCKAGTEFDLLLRRNPFFKRQSYRTPRVLRQ
jgi:hypothetical protein